jgi:hypothetical protein
VISAERCLLEMSPGPHSHFHPNKWLEREFERRKSMRRECCVIWPLEGCAECNDAAIMEIKEDGNQEKQQGRGREEREMLMTQHLDEMAQEELLF